MAALAGLGNDARLLQISAPVQAGSCGGPALDANGFVLGVVVSKLDAARVYAATGDLPQNVNFAIKASIAHTFLEAQGLTPQTAASTDTGARHRKWRRRVERARCTSSAFGEAYGTSA